MRIIFIHCITTIINLVNHVILIVYIIVNFRPLIWLNKQHPKSTDIQSNTAGTFHCSLSLGTIFIDWAKNKQTNYLPILCLKCQLLDINFSLIELYRKKKQYHTCNHSVVLNTSMVIITCSTQPGAKSHPCWYSLKLHSFWCDIAWMSHATTIEPSL